jgi:hypothetical protein
MAKKSRILHSPSDPQEFPHRFLLRRGNNFYRMVDLQILDEPGGRLSVYLKPPIGHLYQSRKPTNKLSFQTGGLIEINLNNDVTKGVACFNPYASWHSSGKAHINGYSTKKLERETVLNDSEAISISDTAVPPHIIFTGAFPLNGLSHVKTSPPPDDFDGNYIEISSKPHRKTDISKDSTVHYVLDMAELRPGSIVMDVMVHNRGVEVDIEKNHPYPHNGEMYFVAPPLKIAPNNSLSPAVSVFFYQPVNDNVGITIEKQPSTIWVRSKGARADQFFQYETL